MSLTKMYAQTGCVDSSTHYTYDAQINDSFVIQKIISCNDGGKLYQGQFIKNNGVPYFEKNILLKINNAGQIKWCKKISTQIGIANELSIEKITEAKNGNIFLLSHLSNSSTNSPFIYLVLSAQGNLINQNKIGFSNVANLSNRYFNKPLLTPYGTDSVLVGLYLSVDGSDNKERIIIGSVANNGQLGQFISYQPPFFTLVGSYFDNAKLTGNIVELYGSSYFNNSCINNGFEQPAYPYLKIDLSTKQIIDKKAYCIPFQGSGLGYFNSQYDLECFNNSFHNVFPQANGNIIISSTYMGLEFNGTDTVNRLFSISEFDKNFNHIKSQYITTTNKFKRNCVYSLYIDSFNNRHIQIHDKPKDEIYYAVGDASNNYYFQKKISFLSAQQNKIFTRQNFLEKGYFTSFNFISKNLNNSKIDNYRILTRDTAASCFGTTTQFLSSKVATASALNFQGDFIVQNMSTISETINFIIEDYHMQTNIICNIVNKCDTIKITAPDTVCNISQPVIITAYKNPLCNGKVNFVFDTTQVTSYNQINDTTLYLTFSKSYQGKVYAQPSTCNKLIDSVNIVVNALQPKINLGNDTLFCPKSTYLLNAYNRNFISYQWQNGQTDSAIIATTAGVYSIIAKDICNRVYKDTLIIKPSNFSLKIEKDTTICLSESIVLKATSNYLNYIWTPNTNLTLLSDNTAEVNPQTNTKYYVKAERFSGCFLTDTVEVKVINCPQYIYFPNSFTPNNDNKNDYFKPLIGGALKKYQLTIYNRWGQLIFCSANKDIGWNGLYKNIIQENGVFVWKCEYQFFDKPLKVLKGTLVLIK